MNYSLRGLAQVTPRETTTTALCGAAVTASANCLSPSQIAAAPLNCGVLATAACGKATEGRCAPLQAVLRLAMAGNY